MAKPKYEYVSSYEGNVKITIPFNTLREARAFFKKQALGLTPNDATRIRIMRCGDRYGKAILDSWDA